ncbi:hypothetical protein O6H91_02G075500 [Diphasiastrum complanatum]|nr:hypothetical protein O6H91_02G049500 [Diphasiastrum complanatum]KAJ7565796.1 hypothetical protein O6H91_02G075500 [Diphasiastrum complanatum]
MTRCKGKKNKRSDYWGFAEAPAANGRKATRSAVRGSTSLTKLRLARMRKVGDEGLSEEIYEAGFVKKEWDAIQVLVDFLRQAKLDAARDHVHTGDISSNNTWAVKKRRLSISSCRKSNNHPTATAQVD